MAKTQYAHFPGGGPKGETCGKCAHLIETTLRRTGEQLHKVCAKAAAMTGTQLRDLAPVDGRTPSCRYWERRE